MDYGSLPAAQVKLVERTCDAFESAWRAGGRPRIEEYVAGAPEAWKRTLLAALLEREVEMRGLAGERPEAEEYRRRFADDVGLIEAAFQGVKSRGDRSVLAPGTTEGGPPGDSDDRSSIGRTAVDGGHVTCVCGRRFRVRPEYRGKRGKCVHCGQTFVFPFEGVASRSESTRPPESDSDPTPQVDDPYSTRPQVDGTYSTRVPLDDSCSTRSTTTSLYEPGALGGNVSDSRRDRFRILNRHDGGALGDVFVAVDEELQRKVALKSIQKRYADDDRSRARFLFEAEITGNLEHPSIVPVYGLGCYDDGRPYYAMRFIRGNSLKEAIAEFHDADAARAREPGKQNLMLLDLLRRFLDVCNAMDYAHSRGILHRDLKPANVMLGPYGETLVVDWGMAKSIRRGEGAGDGPEATLDVPSAGWIDETVAGGLKGTPAYMSPEQAAGRVDLGPASDVYGLGSTFYSLLTGQPPFRGARDKGIETLLAEVQRGEFPPPRQVNRALSPALEAICLKAMATDPGDRYASPREMADDLKHWMADEPVSAHREGWTQRLARWSRRNRAWVRAGAAAMLLVTLVSTVAFAVVTRFYSSEQAQRRKSDGLFRFALANNLDVGKLAEELRPIAGTKAETVKKVLGLAARNYEALLRQGGETPELLEGKAKMLNAFSDVYLATGDVEQALADATEAQDIYRSLLDRESGNLAWQGGRATSVEKRGSALAARGRIADALATFRESLGLRSSLAKRDPGNPEWTADLARSHHLIGTMLDEQGDFLGAEAAFDQAIALSKDLVRRAPENSKWQADLVASLEMRARSRFERKEGETALADGARALEIARDLAGRDPENADRQRDVARIQGNLGRDYTEMGRIPDARESLEQSLKTARRFSDLDPSDVEWRRQVYACRYFLADLDKSDRLVDSLREQLALLREQAPLIADRRAKSPSFERWRRIEFTNWLTLASTLLSLGREGIDRGANLDEAHEFATKALSLYGPKDDSDPTSFRAMTYRRGAYQILGEVLAARGDVDGSRESSSKAIELPTDFIRRQAARDPGNLVWSYRLAAELRNNGSFRLVMLGPAAAESAYREACDLCEQLVSREPANVLWLEGLANAHANMAAYWTGRETGPGVLEGLGKVAASLGMLSSSDRKPATQPGAGGDSTPEQAYQDSLAAYRRAIEIRERIAELEPTKPARHLELAQAYETLSERLSSHNDGQGAEAAYRKRFDALARLDELELGEARRDLLTGEELISARTWASLLTKKFSAAQRVIDVVGARGKLSLNEQIYQLNPGWYAGSRLVESGVDLARSLNSPTIDGNGVAEVRKVLKRSLAVLRELKERGGLHKAQETLAGRIEATLKRFPAREGRPELDGPASEASDALDYGRLARLLLDQGKVRDLFAILESEAEEAAAMKWPLVRLHGTIVSSELVVRIGNAMVDLQKDDATALGPRSRELAAMWVEILKSLGNCVRLTGEGDHAGALSAYREFVRLHSDFAEAHIGLGFNLRSLGDYAGAVLAYREAVRLRPDLADAHLGLGFNLAKQGDTTGSATAFDFIRTHFDDPETRCRLGFELLQLGRPREALVELERGHEQGSRRKDWSIRSAEWLAECRRMVKFDEKLPAILRGEANPADQEERFALADLCTRKSRHAAAARLYEVALAGPSGAAAEFQDQRYSAACAATLAGVGRGVDDPPPGPEERPRWRRQAVAWLRFDLDAHARHLKNGPEQARSEIRRQLGHWRADRDLAGIRDEDALASLPEAERADCRALWADVAALLERYASKKP